MHSKRFHNIFDFENRSASIGDREAMRNLVQKIADAVDMKILEGPIIAEGVQSNPGLSALAIIDFSHISIHTFTKYNEALVDVFSCKQYDRGRVLNVVKEALSTPETKIRQQEVWWG
ncbi:hypothetical protein A3F27_03400 [Candidatus Kaiserbacteria bacterium RIFCSPHIGHO2_12_FULL_53_13]|uniref:S-adenosylmethionine decarboxylase proenzyme n=1 Tax=Candidatus Kaiserbacteria bacterium RIFCSPHIGHO2_12_FULL_53_13 TaxID=1798502 RepID=A0A1F6E656_9BACT|nr:MAG: hypothetical protein A3F27_03400 [Candidatus Kaiserbacteria bacterium RIFCSPHIGHO2_12_FULL_53_13]OGG74383.1 MAG: hypothetical protein A3A37_00245 [Candidatus Kaiserbacteria bacterium RIFCSPLOWO2_01_FULL_52_36]